MIADALTYPVRRNGLIMIILGAIFSVLLQIGQRVPLLGLAVGVFSAGYFTAFYFDIISISAAGGNEVPDWPDFSDFMDDILVPFCRIVFVVIISFAAPVAVALACDNKSSWFPAALIGAIAFSCIYYPMAVIGVVVFGGVKGSLPHIVLPGIVKCLPGYLLAVVALAAIFALSGYVQVFTAQIPYAGWLITTAVSLYALMFQARYIGLFYLSKSAKLGWD